MKFTHLYTGDDGESHFRDVTVELEDQARGLKRSKFMKATGISFLQARADFDHGWHNAPRRQFVITLEGMSEIMASDGTKRRFGPGDIMLADDITGRGHTSRIVSKKPRKFINVTLE